MRDSCYLSMTNRNNNVAEQLPHELEALWRFANRLARQPDEASDLVQQTCLRALEQQHRYKERGSMRSWLFRMAHNLWLNRMCSREARDRQAVTADMNEAQVIDIANFRQTGENASGPEAKMFFEQIYTMVSALPEEQRLVLELVCVEGFSYRETAEILNVRLGTVMSRLSRARLKIGRQVLIAENATEAADNTRNEEES